MVVREARFCMTKVCFCMEEAHGGQGFSPSFNSFVKGEKEQDGGHQSE